MASRGREAEEEGRGGEEERKLPSSLLSFSWRGLSSLILASSGWQQASSSKAPIMSGSFMYVESYVELAEKLHLSKDITNENSAVLCGAGMAPLSA